MTNKGGRYRLTVGFASLILLGVSHTLHAGDIRSEIEAANKVFEAAVSRSDGPGVAALYTDNAQLLPGQSDFVTGTKAISRFWQTAFDSGLKGVTLTTIEVEKHGDTVNEVGKLELRDANGDVLDKGKYIVIWKKQGSSWKLHRDMWNSSVAPAQ